MAPLTLPIPRRSAGPRYAEAGTAAECRGEDRGSVDMDAWRRVGCRLAAAFAAVEDEDDDVAVDARAWGIVAARVAAAFAAAAEGEETPEAAKSPTMASTAAPGSAVASERSVEEAGDGSDDEPPRGAALRAFSGLLSATAPRVEAWDPAKTIASQGRLAEVSASE